MLALNNLSLSFDASVGLMKLTAKYDKSANKVYYNMENGVIITFVLNPLGTGIIGLDTINSIYSDGITLQHYLSKNRLNNAAGNSTQNFMDAHRCRATSGSIRANYRYTIVRMADGSTLIKVHTSVTEQEPEISCN
jgi:hypothetical protein